MTAYHSLNLRSTARKVIYTGLLSHIHQTQSVFFLMKVLSSPAAEILELAGNAARDNKKGCVTPRHILLAIANDEELNQVKNYSNGCELWWLFAFCPQN